MKKVMLLVAILFMIVGCSSKKEEVKVETFLNEQYPNFPEVKNIVHYLKKSPKDVKVLNEEKDAYKVSITTISDTEEWKRIREDIDTSKMKNENLVCEISLK